MTRIIAAIVLFTFAVTPAFAQSPVRLSLADAIARGFENSHRLAEARAREAAARAAAATADLARKPTFGANAAYTRTNHVTEFSVPQPNGTRLVVYPDIPDNFMSRLSFQWPIYTAGRVDALERAAEAEAQAAGADIEATRADLRLEIVRAYWAAVTAREAERVLEESSARAEKQLTDARQRFDVGLIPPNEVSSLEAQRSRERAQLIEASNIREAALIELRRLIGATHDTVIDLSDALDAASLGVAGSTGSKGSTSSTGEVQVLVKQALDARPELRALSFRLGSAEERQRAALTGTKPTVAFTGGVDYANPNQRIFPRKGEWQESWDVGVSVNWNFFDFGRAKSQAAEAAAAATAVRERIAEFESIVSADIRQRLLDVESSQAMVRAASDAVRSAAEARRVVTDRFNAGVATSTDVLVAQVALLETELARTRALANVRLAEARLERALGKQP
ncbi:MAG TPA: TolC family protein [Vicinamibacterales bacterium]